LEEQLLLLLSREVARCRRTSNRTLVACHGLYALQPVATQKQRHHHVVLQLTRARAELLEGFDQRRNEQLIHNANR